MSFRPQVSQFDERSDLIFSTKLQVQRVDQPVRLGGVSGLQPEQGSSDVEATRGAKPETTAGTSELQHSAFLVGAAAAAAAADIAAAAFQQLFPLLGLFSSSLFSFSRSCAAKSKQFILQYNLGILIPYSMT